MNVEYTHVFDYCYDPGDGLRYPVLPLELVNVTNAGLRTHTRGYLDTGCSRSLFDGRLGLLIGVDPTRGRRVSYASATGSSITGILCSIHLEHPQLGRFQLEVGFTQIHLPRNLLGRDFLDLIQFGLRERHQQFYLTAQP